MEALSRLARDAYADPSRLYGNARVARIELDGARTTIAETIRARPEEIVFTSGGTESCNLAVLGGARSARAARKVPKVVVSAVEHTAVLEAARMLVPEGFEVIEVPVARTGRVSVDALREAVAGGCALVSIQHANPEVGTLQPVAEAARIAREAGALVHTDACMTVGNIGVSVAELGVDLLSASAHKAYGPKGAGFLWVRRGIRVRPTLPGDDRERRRRAGMENLPAIAGMAAALETRSTEIESEETRLRALTDRLREELPRRVTDLVVHGDRAERLPSLVAFSVLYVEGEALLLHLDARGIAVHSGSSCTSVTQEPSHVLAAMGALTEGSIRVSLGRGSTDDDVAYFLDELPGVVERVRAMNEQQAGSR